MKKYFFTGFLFVVCLFSAQTTMGQDYYTYGYSSIQYDQNSNTVTVNAYTLLDYGIAHYYTNGVSVTISDPNGNYLDSVNQYGDSINPIEIVNYTTPGNGCGNYKLGTNHWVFLRYYVEYYPTNYGYASGYYNPVQYWNSFSETYGPNYPDYYYYRNFSLLGNGSEDISSDTFLMLEQSEIFSNTGCSAPEITSISPSRGVIGETVDVTINGSGFDSGATVNTSGSGIFVSEIVSQTSTKIVARFIILANANGGNRDVSVTSGTTTSNSKPFFIQIPTSVSVLTKGLYSGGPNILTTLPNGCPQSGSPYGMRGSIFYQVIDQDNQAINSAMVLRENLTENKVDGDPSAPDIFERKPTTSGMTAANGTFFDEPIGSCATGQYNFSTFKQELYIKVSSTINKTIRINNWRGTGSTPYGTLTNNADITITASANP